MKFHDELNPKLWQGFELKEEVKDKLEEITEAFIEYLDIPAESILDVQITGSSANYNYTEHSDLDLHLIVDYEKVHQECPIVEGYLWSMKSAFNREHDISIYGIQVEVYAEDSRQSAVSNGVYSLLDDKWIKKPEKVPPTENDTAVEAKYNEIKDIVDKLDDSEEAEEVLNKVYEMRKAGLSKEGEYSTENLAFKKLRNEGYIDMLKKIKKEKIDKQLTLESFETLDRYKLTNKDDYNKSVKAIDDIINGKQSISKEEYGQLLKAITRTEKEAESGSFTINIEMVKDKAKMQKSKILQLYKNSKNESYVKKVTKELQEKIDKQLTLGRLNNMNPKSNINESWDTYSVQYQVIDRNDRIATKRKEFKTEKALQNWVAKQEDNPNFYGILATSYPDEIKLKENNEDNENKTQSSLQRKAGTTKDFWISSDIDKLLTEFTEQQLNSYVIVNSSFRQYAEGPTGADRSERIFIPYNWSVETVGWTKKAIPASYLKQRNLKTYSRKGKPTGGYGYIGAEKVTWKVMTLRQALETYKDWKTVWSDHITMQPLKDCPDNAIKSTKINKELSLESYNESDNDLTNFCIIIDGDYNWLEEYGTFKSCKAAQEWLDKYGEEEWMYSQLTKGEMKDLGIDEYGGYVNESINESETQARLVFDLTNEDGITFETDIDVYKDEDGDLYCNIPKHKKLGKDQKAVGNTIKILQDVAKKEFEKEGYDVKVKSVEYPIKNESINEDPKIPELKKQIRKMFPWIDGSLYIWEPDYEAKCVVSFDFSAKNGRSDNELTIFIRTDHLKVLYTNSGMTGAVNVKEMKISIDENEFLSKLIDLIKLVKPYIDEYYEKINKGEVITYHRIVDEWEEELSKFISSLPKKLGKKYDVHQTDETVYVNYKDKTAFIEPIKDSTQIIKIGLLDDEDNMEITSEELELEDFGKEDVKNIMDTIKELFKTKNESIKEEFFIGNDKYIIVPVSYANNDIRILDKKTGEFLKDENGDNLKFSTEEECGNYIKSLDESIKEPKSIKDINEYIERSGLIEKSNQDEYQFTDKAKQFIYSDEYSKQESYGNLKMLNKKIEKSLRD